MHRHSLSVSAIPASAPTSPATSRLNRSERIFASPVTPQRIPRAQKGSFRSPITPASNYSTPYTPLSLRSFSTSSSSTLTTPGSATSLKHILVPQSPENNAPVQSLSDIAENWRSRANENGIKVSAADDSHFADDEASDRTPSDASPTGFVNEEALLPPPFLSNHRRTRTQSSIVASPHLRLSSHALHTPARRTLAVLNTPPQKPTNANHLKLKGSYTDPAHTRRRPSFGQMSTELFDIEENAFEPYPQSFSSSPAHPLVLQDPFQAPGLSTITESVQQHFHDPRKMMRPDATLVTPVSSCSVCGRSGDQIAILDPCSHPLCSACLTSALNIVGEKDMECAVCHQSVENFHLQAPPMGGDRGSPPVQTQRGASPRGFPFSDAAGSPLQRRSYRPDGGLLPSAFENNVIGSLMSQLSLYDAPLDSSTPTLPPASVYPQPAVRSSDNIVLRIDNVPWDITPPAIIAWLKQPVVRVHVLLDPRGKTLSHAFVELATEEHARAALRGVQNSVLGKGRRARGVTVTRSGQEELMRALFPTWKGRFEGSRPAVNGLSREQLIEAFQASLMTETELASLLHLIRSPDSHFLKVPSLPFHSLISILSKFPSDLDSRVFWSSALRDALFNITFTATQVLANRLNEGIIQNEPSLLEDVLRAGMNCQAFTSQQIDVLSDIASSYLRSALAMPSLRPSTASPAGSSSHQRPGSAGSMMWDNTIPVPGSAPYSAIAREFGIEEQLVHALAQRLNGLAPRHN
ncbi:hypothetical protein BJ138DRAFT_1102315 [Hygrophoropsis aurantiaca]|uniref:Uncharacterized protein n=1 Tax=Hygrophoropsis aurantiaca TaxID=72124 RepID=A0ACB8A9Z1_9AGAM|nr:hypothetical protein BJ138DRAFT_1102315 [Hygrophoropsis aurantiaca]